MGECRVTERKGAFLTAAAAAFGLGHRRAGAEEEQVWQVREYGAWLVVLRLDDVD